MFRKLLSVSLIVMLIASCATSGHVPVVVDTACDWVKPIYLTEPDIAGMESQTKRDILAHNVAWQNNCENQISTPGRDKSVPARGKGLR